MNTSDVNDQKNQKGKSSSIPVRKNNFKNTIVNYYLQLNKCLSLLFTK